MSSLKMDLYRRDFTINTLAIKLNKREYGTLVDYFGGQKDIREKTIRVLHNLSFVEDPTRVLRAVRFEQRFGFKIGRLTIALMKNAAAINSFKDLSGRRLFLELRLLLMEQEPLKAIERLNELGLLQVIWPEASFTTDMRNLLEEIRGVLSWFNLLYLDESYEPWKVYWHGLTSWLEVKSLRRVADRMQMADGESRRMVDQRLDVTRVLDSLYRFDGANNYALYTLLSHYDTEILLYMMAKANNRTIKRHISNYFTRLRGAKTLLTGKDLKAMGFPPGPIYRKILEGLLEARLNHRVSTREDEVALIQEKFGTVQQRKKAQ